MQKNHPKSSALRQTKICMAVAAVVTAAALPGYAVAEAVDPIQDQRNSRLAALQVYDGPIKKAGIAEARAVLELEHAETFAALATTVNTALVAGGNEGTAQQRFDALQEVLPLIQTALDNVRENESLGRLGAEDGAHHDRLISLQKAAKAVTVTNIADNSSGEPRDKLNGLVAKNEVDSTVAQAQAKAATAQQSHALLKRKVDAWTAVGNEADVKRLAVTSLLDANAAGAIVDGASVLTWSDKNLKAFDVETAVSATDAHDRLAKASRLEIGSFSGDASNALHGAESTTRAIGTIHALDDAKHNVNVAGGTLNVHHGIEGQGALTMTVGAGGTLNFVAQAVGAKGGIAGQNVVLSAGNVTGGGAADGDQGAIAFERGMSAGEATIGLHSGGKLAFNQGADAGHSKIAVGGAVTSEQVADRNKARLVDNADLKALPVLTAGIAATLAFDQSSAGNAEIANQGVLTFAASDLSAVKLTNEAAGTVAITGKRVNVVDKDGKPVLDDEEKPTQRMLNSLGGTAEVTNRGTLSATNMALQGMTLNNEGGTATMSASEGGNAMVANASDATLRFVDTQLEEMRLTNSGRTTLSGSTTAGQAKIDMAGGVLDISEISAVADVQALHIGSLSGKGGAIHTGDTTLVLGALNDDAHFAGTISQRAPIVAGDDGDEAAGDSNASSDADVQALDVALEPSDSQRMALDATPAALGSDVVKMGTGNLTLAGDQSGVSSLSVNAGTVTAAHANALGAGTLSIAKTGTVALSTDVSGVTHVKNAGALHLDTNKLTVQTYSSEAGAKIKSRVEKVEGEIVGGQIHVTQIGDFSNTKLDVAVADDIEVSDLLGNFQVVTSEENAAVLGGEVTVGSITGGKQPDPTIEPGVETKITEQNLVKFLAADGGYSANEQAVLASVDGVALGDLASGKIGGSVLSAMALQTAGSDEQRRSARLLSGESLVNNATAAQGSATSFQRGMQTRMIAGGSMFDDTTANGAMASDNGIAGWASFKGGNASQRGDGMSFDVKGLDGAIGIDKRVAQNTLVGASVGLGNQESKAKGMPGESKVNSVSVGLYGSHLAATNWFVNGGVSYTNHSVKTDRTVAARNASARLTGKTSGQTFGMFGEVGKRFGVSSVNIDPSVGVRVASTRLNAFDETNRDGQGNDGLKVGSQSQTSTRGVVGVRLWSEVASIAGGKVAPSLRLSYEHEFGNTQSSLTNAIYGAPSQFTVKGPKLGRDIFTADLGVDMQIKKQLEVRLGGNVSVRKGESALGGGISAKYRF